MISEKSIVGLSNRDGTISPVEFRKGAHLFSEKWKTACRTHEHDLPPWSWVCCKNPLFFTSHEVIITSNTLIVCLKVINF